MRGGIPAFRRAGWLRGLALVVWLAAAVEVCGNDVLNILEPRPNATASLLPSGRLRLEFEFAQGVAANIKIDVFGFADPEGWADVHMGQMENVDGGRVRGSAEVGGLEPGAVTPQPDTRSMAYDTCAMKSRCSFKSGTA